MDTSEIYIKMCDCLEIQDEWKPKEGDFFAFCGDPKIIKDYEAWALERRELSDIREWNEIIKAMGGHFVDHFLEARECFVFLPRQDQIQWMLKGNLTTFYWLEGLWGFTRKRVNVSPEKYADTSMEQLWLAFYMYEKHRKIWNGDKWMKK